MNVIQNPTLVPNGGGFVYIDPDSGVRLVHCTVDHLAVIARKHRTANNYRIKDSWSQDFIDNVCRNTKGQICFDEPPPSAGERAISLARALYDSARSGFKTATAEQVQERKTVCETSGPGGAACEYFHGWRGLLDVSCGKCGCSKMKLHLKTSQCPLSKWPEI